MNKVVIICVGVLSFPVLASNYVSIIGTENTILRAETWSEWSNDNIAYSCTTWNPESSTVDLGTLFSQNRNCSQDQKRSKGSFEEIKTIIINESQSETGTKNFTTTERADSYSSFSNTGVLYSCSFWTPLASSVNLGSNFTQSSACSQDQVRSRNVYQVWADNSETFLRTEQENKTISSTKTQNEIGTKNFKVSERFDSYSEFVTGTPYDCSAWSREPSEVAYGQSVLQGRDCSQDKTQTRNVYDVYYDSTEILNRVDTNTETINIVEYNPIIGTLEGHWVGYSEQTWKYTSNGFSLGSPPTNKCGKGDSFSQVVNIKTISQFNYDVTFRTWKCE